MQAALVRTQTNYTNDASIWKERALNAERALRGEAWNDLIPGFTLFESRLLHLLIRHQRLSFETLTIGLYQGYADEPSDRRTFRTLFTRCRQKLPRSIRIEAVTGFGWQTPDRSALSAHVEKLKRTPARRPSSVNRLRLVTATPAGKSPAEPQQRKPKNGR